MKFQNFIRSQKRLQSSNLRDHHAMGFLDFGARVGAIAWLMGDRGISEDNGGT